MPGIMLDPRALDWLVERRFATPAGDLASIVERFWGLAWDPEATATVLMDQPHFTREFSAVVGMSPSRYAATVTRSASQAVPYQRAMSGESGQRA